MKKISILTLASLVWCLMLTSCGSDSTIGQSIVQDKVEVIVDSAFTVSGATVPTKRVQSRTTAQLIGRIDAKGYGRLSSDVVTQFMPSSQIETEGVTAAGIDSLVLYMWMSAGDFVGDSITPMGVEVYRLNKTLPSPIYSDFNPEEYYDKNSPLASTIYNISHTSGYLYADSVFANGVEIKVKLPHAFATEIYDSYVSNPTNFASPTAFSDNVLKGLYIKNSFGSGRLLRSSSTLMTMYYHKTYYDEDKGRDTTVLKHGNYFAVTPEIVSNNDINLEISPAITERISQGEQIVLAPVGLEVEMRFPTPELMASYKSHGADLSVLNNLSFSFPAEGIENEYSFVAPTYLLMVLSKDKDAFFAKNKLPDNITSFYATYNNATNTYNFGDMRQYLAEMLKKESLKEEDYTFTIIPVSCTFETSQSGYYYGGTTQTLSMMTPYMAAPTMARLLLDKAKIKLTYSTQTIQK